MAKLAFIATMLGDPRLLTKSYGRAMIASLPPMRLVREEAEAVAFLRSGDPS